MVEDDDKDKDDTTGTSQDSSPDKSKDSDADADDRKADGVKDAQDSHGDLSPGVKFELKKLRSERRVLREENERLKEEKAAQKPHDDERDLLGDDAPNDDRTGEKTVRDLVRSEVSVQRVKDEKNDAYNHILSQDDINDEKDLQEVVSIMQETGLDVFAKQRPLQAAELALKELRLRRSSKGKGSDADRANAGDATSGRSGSSSASSGRSFTRQEIGDMSREVYDKNRDDIMTAQKAGRIK